jgi:hypothetical protein
VTLCLNKDRKLFQSLSHSLIFDFCTAKFSLDFS